MSLAVIVIANDFSAINVALPTMEKDFDTNINTIQWVVNAYALTFGVMIVTGGKLADMFGRRNAFFLGTAIFASMSALGGAAQTETWLIASRTLMGIGGALMWPAILGMTFAILPEEKAGLAGGIILGAAGLGNALGPLIGGVLTDLASWRWIFFLNVPVAAFAVLVTYWLVHVKEPESADHKIDYAGITTLSVGLVSLLVALDQVDDWGWGDPKVIGLLALCVVMLIAFIPIERRADTHALVPKEVMRNESFTASCLAILFMSATFFAALLYLPQFMEKQLGYSPLEAGVGILPFLATFALVSFIAGPLYNRVGPKVLAIVGAACITVGPFLLSMVDQGSGYDSLIIGMVVLGIGVGSFYPTATTAGVTSVDSSQTSLAGGIIYMFQIAGGSIGLGLTTTVFSAAVPPFVDGLQAGFRLDASLSSSAAGFSRAQSRPPTRPKDPYGQPSAAALFDVVNAGTAEQHVAAFAAAQQVVAATADKTIVAAATVEPVVTAAADEDVVADPTDQFVVATASDQFVVAGAAAQRRRHPHFVADDDGVVAAVGVDFEAGDRARFAEQRVHVAFGMGADGAADFEHRVRFDCEVTAVGREVDADQVRFVAAGQEHGQRAFAGVGDRGGKRHQQGGEDQNRSLHRAGIRPDRAQTSSMATTRPCRRCGVGR
jgi:EmrB/QacA subfamily drug resistance transporter